MKNAFLKHFDVKSVIIGALVAGLVMVFMGSSSNTNPDLVCNSLKVVNGSGSTVLELSIGAVGGRIITYNAEGELTTYLGTNTDGAGHMKCFTEKGEEAAFAGTNTSGSGQFECYASNGTKLNYVGNGFLRTYNEKGSETTYIGTSTDDGGTISVSDKDGNSIFSK